MSRIIKAPFFDPELPVLVSAIPYWEAVLEVEAEADEGLAPEVEGAAPDREGREVLVYGPSKAQEIMRLAQERAARLLAEVEAQAEDLRAQAQEVGQAEGHEKGLAEGRKAGREEMLAQMLGEVGRIAQLASQAMDFRAQVLEECEPQLVELALKIAEKVIGRELAARPELVAEMAKGAVLEMNSSEEVVLRANPQDAPLLKQYWAEGSGNYLPAHKWKILPDNSLRAGDLIVEAEASQLDARLETKLARIAEAFQGARSGMESDEGEPSSD